MQLKVSTVLPVVGLLMLATAPALAQGAYAPSSGTPRFSYYQNPDGSYDSYADFVRDIRGRPCGIECSQRAAARWGRVTSNTHYHRHRRHRHHRHPK